MKDATTTKNATDAAIYREAARKLAEGESVHSCSCLAIQQTIRKLHTDYFPRAVRRYIRVFMPAGSNDADIWGLHWGETPAAIQKCRILALCFMAAMVEAGDA